MTLFKLLLYSGECHYLFLYLENKGHVLWIEDFD